MKTLQKKPKRDEHNPWKDSKKHTCEFETHIKRLNAAALTNAACFRIHLLPRSYDERVKAPHTLGFKYPTAACHEFP